MSREDIIGNELTADMMPEDVLKRFRDILEECIRSLDYERVSQLVNFSPAVRADYIRQAEQKLASMNLLKRKILQKAARTVRVQAGRPHPQEGGGFRALMRVQAPGRRAEFPLTFEKTETHWFVTEESLPTIEELMK